MEPESPACTDVPVGRCSVCFLNEIQPFRASKFHTDTQRSPLLLGKQVEPSLRGGVCAPLSLTPRPRPEPFIPHRRFPGGGEGLLSHQVHIEQEETRQTEGTRVLAGGPAALWK